MKKIITFFIFLSIIPFSLSFAQSIQQGSFSPCPPPLTNTTFLNPTSRRRQPLLLKNICTRFGGDVCDPVVGGFACYCAGLKSPTSGGFTTLVGKSEQQKCKADCKAGVSDVCGKELNRRNPSLHCQNERNKLQKCLLECS